MRAIDARASGSGAAGACRVAATARTTRSRTADVVVLFRQRGFDEKMIGPEEESASAARRARIWIRREVDKKKRLPHARARSRRRSSRSAIATGNASTYSWNARPGARAVRFPPRRRRGARAKRRLFLFFSSAMTLFSVFGKRRRLVFRAHAVNAGGVSPSGRRAVSGSAPLPIGR